MILKIKKLLEQNVEHGMLLGERFLQCSYSEF